MIRRALRYRLLLISLLCVTAQAVDVLDAAAADPAVVGKWGTLTNWPNVAIHAHVLPNGKVLFWGRREWVNGVPEPVPPHETSSLDVHRSIPRVWDPANPADFHQTANAPGYNLFCSGHTFLPDGKLFVAGGHIHDQEGESHASTYDFRTDHWETLTAQMSGGRWYPSAVTLADGSVLVAAGTSVPNVTNTQWQLWKDGNWTNHGSHNDVQFYPRLHLVSDGTVFLTGAVALTQFLDSSGNWTFLVPGDLDKSSRKNGFREYAPSVLYGDNKVIFIGGRNNPTANCEIVDAGNHTQGWQATNPMHFARTQHNATLLPDGTVLVTGGTQGTGGKDETLGSSPGFNDLRPGQPIHAAERWDPATQNWTILAEEQDDRCYHSTAILLPDATVLSAGGGEYRPDNKHDNELVDTKRTAQIFSPPYLFKGTERPAIATAPASVTYNQTFDVALASSTTIKMVTWVRLSSVTHSFNFSQRINFLAFTQTGLNLTITTPAEAKVCPPGHYMLFVIDSSGVPSKASIVRILP